MSSAWTPEAVIARPEAAADLLNDLLSGQWKLRNEISNQSRELKCLRTVVERYAEIRDVMLRALHYPENGHHYCRWCTTGTHDGWNHDEYCFYKARRRQVDEARNAALGIADVAIVRGRPERSDHE